MKENIRLDELDECTPVIDAHTCEQTQDGTEVVVPNPDCSDPSYRAEHPNDCRDTPKLIIKPEITSICALKNVQFEAYLVSYGEEQLLTTGVVFYSSDQLVAQIGGASGKCVGLKEGIATISAKWQEMEAYSQVTVMGDSCCDDTKVGMMILIDNSKSMQSKFGPIPPPAGAVNPTKYGSKLTFAKAAARQFAIGLNTAKDVMGIMTFNESSTLVRSLTNDLDRLKLDLATITVSQDTTNMHGALRDAIDELNSDTTLTHRVILLISDGENKEGSDPRQDANAFKDGGGIIVSVAVRAHDDGYELMADLCSGGFFISGHIDTQDLAMTWLSGIKGYFCAAICDPPGGVTVSVASLNYDGFDKWDIVEDDNGDIGAVDLIGGESPYELFDLLPGNGLYVDLAGSFVLDPVTAMNGKLKTKTNIEVTGGKLYTLKYSLAGNQRANVAGYEVTVTVHDETNDVDLATTVESVDYWLQDFTEYTQTFTPAGDCEVSISIQMTDYPTSTPGHSSFGILLDNVILENTTDDAVVFSDTFDTENSYTIPANECDHPSNVDPYAYCVCITEPITAQVPDPYTPFVDVEE